MLGFEFVQDSSKVLVPILYCFRDYRTRPQRAYSLLSDQEMPEQLRVCLELLREDIKGSYKDHCFHTGESTLLWPTGGDRRTLKNKTKQNLLKMFQSFSKNTYMGYLEVYI